MLDSVKRQSLWRQVGQSTFLKFLLLGLPVAILYGQFLWNPFVFDDQYFFDGKVHAEYVGKVFSLQLRWLPYATFEWTRALLGRDLLWLHLGNLALHLANISVLYLLLRRLFGVVLPAENKVAASPGTVTMLPQSWLAFFGALIFALHPAAVYAVAYLTQRSTLMATFFTLIMLRLLLEGIVRESRWRRWWLMASAGAYFFAVLSKEHAIMAPAVALAMLLLLRQPSRSLFRQVWPTFALYGLIGAFVVFQIKSHNILGQAYEPRGVNMLARLARQDPGFDRSLAYPLSVITQSFLFFKYLLLWLIPNSAWMSVAMVEQFAGRLWSFPQIAGFIGFLLYPVVAVRMLLQRGARGLFGFALLCPWFLFATEFSTVRIQESFVLYRSYLWMPVGVAAIPFLLRNMSANRAAAVLTAFVLIMVPATWSRLMTFSDPLRLWDDAARLVVNDENRPGVERIFHNRGIMFSEVRRFQQAIGDYSKAIAISPEYSYAYNDRGAAYLEIQEYRKAQDDFTKAIELNPIYHRPYIGRALAYEAQGNAEAARQDYKVSCLGGVALACRKFRGIASDP